MRGCVYGFDFNEWIILMTLWNKIHMQQIACEIATRNYHVLIFVVALNLKNFILNLRFPVQYPLQLQNKFN